METVEQELAGLRHLDGLGTHLTRVQEPHKALRYTLRAVREFFGASDVCIAALHAGRPDAEVLFSIPKRGPWDLSLLTRFIRHAHPPVGRDMLIATLKRRGEAWGAIALTRTTPP